MVALIERLKKEWHVIKGAPFSFLVVCAIAIGLIWGGFRFLYHDKLTESDKRAEQWKSDTEYWKDVASRPKATEVIANVSPTPVPLMLKHARMFEVPKMIPTPTPVIAQIINAAGGIPITGGNVSNPTVINNGPPPPRVAFREEVTAPLPADHSSEKVIKIHVITDNPIPGLKIGLVFSGPITTTKPTDQASQDDPIIKNAAIQQFRWGGGLVRRGVEIPNSVGVEVLAPEMFTPGQELIITVRSKQDVHLVEAMRVTSVTTPE
jgi:hypothetical protein